MDELCCSFTSIYTYNEHLVNNYGTKLLTYFTYALLSSCCKLPY